MEQHKRGIDILPVHIPTNQRIGKSRVVADINNTIIPIHHIVEHLTTIHRRGTDQIYYLKIKAFIIEDFGILNLRTRFNMDDTIRRTCILRERTTRDLTVIRSTHTSILSIVVLHNTFDQLRIIQKHRRINIPVDILIRVYDRIRDCGKLPKQCRARFYRIVLHNTAVHLRLQQIDCPRDFI